MAGLSRILASFLLLLVIIMISCQHLSLAFMSNEFSSTRYFTDKGILPPLAGIGISNLATNQTMDGYTTDTSSVLSHHGSSIPVTYTNDPKSVYRWLSDHLPYEGCFIGFDVESLPRTRQRKPLEKRTPFDSAATVQLATADSCIVIHLARRSGKHSLACAPILKAVLCDDLFVKAGCAIDEDLMSLYDLWGGLDAKSRLDLGFLGGYERIGNRFGLKALSKGLLGVDLPKPKEIAISDWSAIPLTESQIVYSARDAWAGAAIAEKLAEVEPETFSHGALVEFLPQVEPSISDLVSKQRRRVKARKDLKQLIAPYANSNALPDQVRVQARALREIINAPVMEPHLVFDVEHLSDL